MHSLSGGWNPDFIACVRVGRVEVKDEYEGPFDGSSIKNNHLIALVLQRDVRILQATAWGRLKIN